MKGGYYFDPMDDVLGHRPVTEPPVTVDTLADHHPELSEPSMPDLFDDPSTNTSSGTSEFNPTEGNNENEESVSATPIVRTTKKKGKRSRAEIIANEVVEKVMTMQSQSDRLMIELEEKRLKLEEKQFEQKVQLRREEREFQLQMVRMMMGHPLGASHMPTNYPFGNHFTSPRVMIMNRSDFIVFRSYNEE